MNIVKLNETNLVEKIEEYLSNEIEIAFWGVPTKSSVFVGTNTNLNKNFCLKNNIELLEFPNEGGVIVVSEGDFDIGFISKDINNNFNYNFATKIKEYLNKKGLDAKFDGNDLILNEKYKCGSFSSRRLGNMLYSAFHISINVDLQMIKNICTKPMVKIPKGLSSYGISTEEIKILFLNFMEDINV